MFTPFFVGVDVAKHTLEACKLVDGKHRCRKFNNSPFGFRSLLNWIQESTHEQPVHLAMEATGRYHLALAHFAWANQLHVHVLSDSSTTPRASLVAPRLIERMPR